MSTLLSLYWSKLNYGYIVYGSARRSYLKMLDPVPNLSLRVCLGAFRISPVESLQVKANEPPLSLRRERLSVQYALKLYSNADNPAFDCSFHPGHTQQFVRKPNAIPTFGMRTHKLW